MKILPLAFDSLGTRSMATFIETRNVKILIDPGVALAPKRFQLPPHRVEVERMLDHWQKIKEYAKKSDILIVTHYHYDHHNPKEPQIFEKKIAMLKHPEKNINKSQNGRAKKFLKALGEYPKEIVYSDGNEFEFGKTLLKFSEAVPHGLDSRLGYVTEVLVKDDCTMIHTSDVLGPCVGSQGKFIVENNPEFLICDGQMPYMQREAEMIQKKISEKCNIKKFLIDHHLLRDVKWREKIPHLFEKFDVLTGAEFLGLKNDVLETKRKKLYEEIP